MNNKKLFTASLLFLCANGVINAQKTWSLQECLNYAIDNNIQLKQKKITAASSREDILQSKTALFPSVSFNTNQNVSWRPFAESTINLTNGTMSTSRNTVSYNGSYGINANWTVWNGWRNTNNIKQNEISEKMNELAVEQTANSIQEQITQLYVQILYETEAVKVSEEIVKASEMQRDRAQVMVEVGTLARVDLVQLEAQVTQDLYSLANTKSQLANFKLQLKQLLEIHDDEDFNVEIPDVDDNSVLDLIPNQQSVYNSALGNRPEIKSSRLNIESSEVAIEVARAGYMPTVSITAGIGSSNNDSQKKSFYNQVKTNMSNSIGMTISMPIFDQRQTKTNIRKAKFALQNSELSLMDQQKQLFSTIENYWLNATTSQQQYMYAKANVRSMQESYELVSEQFRLGLKNIVELTTGKNNLLQAEQQLLQTKYTAIFNQAMLDFYSGEPIKL
ncbi:MAG: TolC family protein [Prevotellaceae bacterium]|nr:TolC family protein [Candidatus Minthosoma caballi]